MIENQFSNFLTKKMEHLSVYVRLRPTEEEHLIRPEDNRLVINDELLFNAQSVLVNASQVRNFKNFRIFMYFVGFYLSNNWYAISGSNIERDIINTFDIWW